jgi:hypothetical protein
LLSRHFYHYHRNTDFCCFFFALAGREKSLTAFSVPLLLDPLSLRASRDNNGTRSRKMGLSFGLPTFFTLKSEAFTAPGDYREQSSGLIYN